MAPRLRVRQGDITTFEGDAIVNSANQHLKLDFGVSAAIRRAGGPVIQEECDRLGSVSVGDAVITSAGRLPVKHIIHAVTIGEERATEQAIRSATASALRVAAEHDLGRIAVPVLGSGVGRIAFQDAARGMLDTIRSSPDTDGIEVIVFFGYTTEDAARLEALVG